MSYSSEVLADSPLAYYRLGDVSSSLGTATASTYFTSEPPSAAFDGSATTYWTTNGVASGWLRNQLTGPYALTGYSIRRRDDIPNRNPKDWTFEGSNDGSTWTVLDTQTGITWPTSGETKHFTFTNSTAYLNYRINVTATVNSSSDPYLSIAELSFDGLPYTPPMADSSGNGRGGTYVGTPVLNAASLLVGDSDTAATFNGSTQYAQTTYATWQSPTSFTIEALIKPSTVTGNHEIASRSGTTTGTSTWTFRMEGTVLKFYLWTSTSTIATATSSVTFAANTKYHLAATYDGTTITIYVNGVSTGTATGTLYNAATDPLRIGSFGAGSDYYAGVIDEVAYYGTALSSTRVSAHYTAATTAPTGASGTASLSLSASGATGATDGGTASLSLSASGTTGATAAGTASLNLSATGDTVAPSPASGTASLSLSAGATASASPAGTASLSLLATGTAQAILAASGTATLNLSASGSATMTSGGTAYLNLSAGGQAIAVYTTDLSNALDGLDLLLTATVQYATVIAPAPTNLAERYDVAIPYPVPVMVNGRPT